MESFKRHPAVERSLLHRQLQPKALAAAADMGLIATPSLEQNAPNPFNAETVIRFRTAVDGPVSLTIYDLAGQRVRELIGDARPAGDYTVSWDGTDQAGRDVATGPYIYRLRTQAGDVHRKLLLLR